MMYRYWNDRYYDMMPWNGWWFGFVILAFFLLVILLLLVYRNYLKHSSRSEGPPSSLDVAKTRLAKGEITPEEFAAIKEHLQ